MYSSSLTDRRDWCISNGKAANKNNNRWKIDIVRALLERAAVYKITSFLQQVLFPWMSRNLLARTETYENFFVWCRCVSSKPCASHWKRDVFSEFFDELPILSTTSAVFSYLLTKNESYSSLSEIQMIELETPLLNARFRDSFTVLKYSTRLPIALSQL